MIEKTTVLLAISSPGNSLLHMCTSKVDNIMEGNKQ